MKHDPFDCSILISSISPKGPKCLQNTSYIYANAYICVSALGNL